MTDIDFSCPLLAKGLTCTPCEEFSATHQEIAPLNPKHTLIYGRMNHAHDPLTSKLPTEIIAKIFMNFLPVDVEHAYGVAVERPRPYDRHYPVTNPLSLGAVCAAWRAIAWSTPRLWTSITVCLSYLSETRCNLVHDWLRRSGEHPLYIRIYGMDHKTAEPFSDEILNLFMRLSHRWFYFEYDLVAKYMPYLESAFPHAHILTTLKIGMFSFSEVDLGLIPNLRNLYMLRPWMDNISRVDWQKLTNLEATFPDIDICLWVFSNAPYLKGCTFNIYSNTLEEGTPILRHDHLVFLHITKWRGEIGAAFCVLQLPALQHLVIDSNDWDNVNIVSISDLLRRSKCSLKILDANMLHCTTDDTLLLFSPLADIPSLKNMELRCTSADYPTPRPTCYTIDDLRVARKRLRQPFDISCLYAIRPGYAYMAYAVRSSS